jgi:hypothetical protein
MGLPCAHRLLSLIKSDECVAFDADIVHPYWYLNPKRTMDKLAAELGFIGLSRIPNVRRIASLDRLRTIRSQMTTGAFPQTTLH